ncbi:MAG: class I SAM-dependent methyltransferase [Actinomycetota bacterium]|nr:class I SAM-dependent methyltransferase [Actinomycetota bacterium]
MPADGLRRAWDDGAADWIAWARTPGHDHFFWALTLPALLALLPDPGRLTVDVGGGEGRVARELKARGHKVVVVEGSAALADAARDADPDLEVHTADAAAMPLGDGAADLAVASMSLLNMDDLDAVVAEIARVLAPGGRFCLTTVHPANSLKPLGGFRAGAGYFQTYSYSEIRERDGLRMTFTDTHRPLEAYAGALERAGLLIEALREPRPSDAYVAEHPDVARWCRAPGFLAIRAVKA